MEVHSVGVVTPGCNDCKFLKNRIKAAFDHINIDIVFDEIDYTVDEEQAMEVCERYGFDDIPAFEVAGVVFLKGFDEERVREASRALGI
jgi:glutaredoxin